MNAQVSQIVLFYSAPGAVPQAAIVCAVNGPLCTLSIFPTIGGSASAGANIPFVVGPLPSSGCYCTPQQMGHGDNFPHR